MSFSKILLTISIPTWNRAPLLKELLHQVTSEIINHNLTDIMEVLISNNGSDDNTELISKDFCEKFTFIKYYNNKVNLGLRANVLKSMHMASGEFIILLGDDDRLRKNSLTELINFLERNTDTGFLLDNSRIKKKIFGNNSEISVNDLLENYYWHLGNAGFFVTHNSFFKENITKYGYEFFNESWPHSQLIILGLNQNNNLKSYICDLNLTPDAVHEEATVYNSYYLWRTCYYDLFIAIDSIKQLLNESIVLSAKKFLLKNINQVILNVLQCGIFLDDKHTRHKTARHIITSLKLFSPKERYLFRLIIIALLLPNTISKIISDSYIFITRGKTGIEKKNNFIKSEKSKREKLKNTNNLSIREFKFE